MPLIISKNVRYSSQNSPLGFEDHFTWCFMIPHLPRGLTTHKYNVKRFPLKYWLHYSLTQVRIAESINYLDKYLRINLVREINALLS